MTHMVTTYLGVKDLAGDIGEYIVKRDDVFAIYETDDKFIVEFNKDLKRLHLPKDKLLSWDIVKKELK